MRNLGQYFPIWARWISAAITFLAVAMLILALVLGVRAGQQQLEIKRRQQLSVILQQALEFHNEGRIEAARIAYQEILLLDPDNVAAVDGLTELRMLPPNAPPLNPPTQNGGSTAQVVPLSTVATPPLPTPLAAPPTASAADAENAAAELARAQEVFAAGRWTDAIEQLLPLRAGNPTYERAAVNDLLFEAYVNLATEKDNQNKLQEALTLFDQALALQPDALEIRAERTLIDAYIDAVTYAEADWAAAITALQLIYQQEPDYRDVKTRLQQALRAQSQALADAEEWCQAATILSDLIAIGITPGIVAQREVYQEACTTGATTADADAGTPTTPGTGTPDVEGTTTPTRLATTTAATGAPTTGTILYSANDLANGRSRILAQAVGGSSPALLREEASQPALRADGSRLLYRNLRNDMAGISAWDQNNELLLRFTQYAEDSLPSWSAQGNQFAFASNREGDRLWRVYVAWAESGSEATVLSIGEAPAWHPTADVIVFRGCDNSGNRCGLWQINSRGSDRTPLTDIPTDNRPAWSPDGRYVVFMSEGRNGNFEIYRVEASTGQVLPLTDHPTPDVLPAVSPDGRWVAFLSNRDGSWKIWAVPIGGGTATAIAPVAGTLGSWTEQALQWVP